DSIDICLDCAAARPVDGGPQFELAQIVEAEQLVGRPVLLVIVDQTGIGRRRDEAVEYGAVGELARIAMHDRRLAALRSPLCELLDSHQRVERVPAEERERGLDGTALALVLVAPVRA